LAIDLFTHAFIQEASIGNAPPSEREDEMFSEIGELADIGSNNAMMGGNFSQDTPTTAQDSVSMISGGNPSAQRSNPSDQGQMDQYPSDVLASPGTAGSVEETHPPSIGGRDEADNNLVEGVEGVDVTDSLVRGLQQPMLVGDNGSRDSNAEAVSSEPIVENRYDHPSSPIPNENEVSFLPSDAWSPAGKMHVSPINVPRPPVIGTVATNTPFVGIDSGNRKISDRASSPREDTPLLSDVPPEIITRRSQSDQPDSMERQNSSDRVPSHGSMRSAFKHAFSDVISEEDYEKIEAHNECDIYLKSSVLARAFPERMFALTVTLIFEVRSFLLSLGFEPRICLISSSLFRYRCYS
jgi:hypothetical protein